jgi:transcriptional regulator with XRE-family HTH domain
MAGSTKARSRPAAKGGSGRRPANTDRHVSARIRERRILLGLGRQRVAELVGVTYQQVRMHETGAHRVSAGRLVAYARALGVGVAHLYEGLDGAPTPGRDPQGRKMLELARDFAAIPDPRRREALCHLARVLASVEADVREVRAGAEG